MGKIKVGRLLVVIKNKNVVSFWERDKENEERTVGEEPGRICFMA